MGPDEWAAIDEWAGYRGGRPRVNDSWSALILLMAADVDVAGVDDDVKDVCFSLDPAEDRREEEDGDCERLRSPILILRRPGPTGAED